MKYLLQNPAQVHPMYPRLHLAVFHVSSNAIYSSQQLVPPHLKHTNLAGAIGAAGVLQGKLIRFQQL
jgi:hypothetical protein